MVTNCYYLYPLPEVVFVLPICLQNTLNMLRRDLKFYSCRSSFVFQTYSYHVVERVLKAFLPWHCSWENHSILRASSADDPNYTQD